MDWGQLGMEILGTLMPVIAAVLTALASWGISLLARKWKINLDMMKEAVIRRGLRYAIAGAEEYAARKIKYEGKPITGAEKADWVKARMLELWPDLLPKDLAAMLDEELSLLRGVGATGLRVVGAEDSEG